MSDLISRQALCEYALNQKDKSITPNEIMRFPSAETAKHGEWIEKMWFHCVYDELPRIAYVCSECHVAFPADDYLVENFRYCPHCGAKMDEE